jgi:signal transduction histidine kinase
MFEAVSLEQELRLIRESLNAFILQNQVDLQVDIRCTEIVSIKAYINSILYNLLSNAIQYRSPDRQPLIKVTFSATDQDTILEVKDNGLGLDLARYEGDIFKLYKRFHTHTQGKGLGLYLVKQQVEKLNGRIEVESTPQVGSTFRVFLPTRG